MEEKKKLMETISRELKEEQRSASMLSLLRMSRRGKCPVVRWDLVNGGGGGNYHF